MKTNNNLPKKPLIFTALIFTSALALFIFQNCAKTKIGDLKDENTVTANAVVLNGKQLISVLDATGEQCPAGGKVYSVYTDDNNNFQLDPTEEVLSSQKVCTGAAGSTGATGSTGQNGSNAMISMNRVTVELEACASHSGVQLSTGVDLNKNNNLDASEITQTTILCDGSTGATGGTGATGAAGPAGNNGHNAVFSIVPASASVCPNGGSVIMMALDTNNQGIYTTLLPQQQSATICNGMNGMAAAASPYQIADVIRPCGITVANKEVLLRLENGQILASVSDTVSGYNTRLAFVNDGNYVNTDPSACTFSITTQNKTRSVSWNGSVQVSWQMP